MLFFKKLFTRKPKKQPEESGIGSRQFPKTEFGHPDQLPRRVRKDAKLMEQLFILAGESPKTPFGLRVGEKIPKKIRNLFRRQVAAEFGVSEKNVGAAVYKIKPESLDKLKANFIIFVNRDWKPVGRGSKLEEIIKGYVDAVKAHLVDSRTR